MIFCNISNATVEITRKSSITGCSRFFGPSIERRVRQKTLMKQTKRTLYDVFRQSGQEKNPRHSFFFVFLDFQRSIHSERMVETTKTLYTL